MSNHVVDAQPGSINEMVIIDQRDAVSLGLTVLADLTEVFVSRHLEIHDVLPDFDLKTRYEVKDGKDTRLFLAMEESDVWMKLCCGRHRSFQIHAFDKSGEEVCRLGRTWSWSGECSACANTELGHGTDIWVEAPVGHRIGHLRQTTDCLVPHFTAHDAHENQCLAIKGPFCVYQCCWCPQDVMFQVTQDDHGRYDDECGWISKHWDQRAADSGEEHSFHVQFPPCCPVTTKTIILASVFLVDLMLFENQQHGSEAL